MKKFLLCLLILCSPIPAIGQGVVTGGQRTVTYSGNNASLAPPNTPATNFNTGSGTNTFILSIANPTVAIRIYATNNTANACVGAFSLQMFSSTDPQVTDFNNNLANWQGVLLQSPLGGLVNSVSVNIPASGAAYVTSTAIMAPRVAIQFVNAPAGSCATTSIELTAVITQLSVSTPLVSTNGPNNFGTGNAQNVQGIAPQLSNGGLINPVEIAGVEPASNQNFTAVGLDNSAGGFVQIGGGTTGSASVVSVPPVQKTGELAIVIETYPSATVTTSLNSPWVCWPNMPGNCFGGSPQLSASTLTNVSQGTQATRQWTGSSGNPNYIAAILTITGSGFTAVNNPTVCGSSPCTWAFGGPGAGALLIAAVQCSGASPCSVASITDTQTNTWKRILSVVPNNGQSTGGLDIWAATTLSTGVADTLTYTMATGAFGNSLQLALAGTLPAALNTPTFPIQVDTIGNLVVRQDALSPNQFACNTTISTNTTTQLTGCAAPSSYQGIAVRIYVTDIQVQTTTAGTATALQLKTGTGSNCGTGTANLSAITYLNTVIGLQTFGPFRTPLIAPLQSAVCVTQAGTTPGTSVVEVHGFYAP